MALDETVPKKAVETTPPGCSFARTMMNHNEQKLAAENAMKATGKNSSWFEGNAGDVEAHGIRNASQSLDSRTSFGRFPHGLGAAPPQATPPDAPLFLHSQLPSLCVQRSFPNPSCAGIGPWLATISNRWSACMQWFELHELSRGNSGSSAAGPQKGDRQISRTCPSCVGQPTTSVLGSVTSRQLSVAAEAMPLPLPPSFLNESLLTPSDQPSRLPMAGKKQPHVLRLLADDVSRKFLSVLQLRCDVRAGNCRRFTTVKYAL
jgi:hypothetical protein